MIVVFWSIVALAGALFIVASAVMAATFALTWLWRRPFTKQKETTRDR